MKRNDGGPAFARAGSEDRRQGDMPDGNRYDEPQKGMTLRQWYAGQALAGIVNSDSDDWAKPFFPTVAAWCFNMADAMIAAEAAQPVEGRNP